MEDRTSNLAEFFDRLQRDAPEFINLFTAENDPEFDDAIDSLIARAIEHLESNSRSFADLNENGLTAVLVGCLNRPYLSVTQEEHTNGHVDITIKVTIGTRFRKRLGEAKIYNGPVYHISGLRQLVERYTTGREGRGVLIAYVRKSDITALIQKIRETMDEELPCQQRGPTVDGAIRWSFLSEHGHSCGSDIQVSHFGCNLYARRSLSADSSPSQFVVEELGATNAP